LHDLAVVPRVYEDEPWQASTGWKIATAGVFGSDMFTGFYRMESHYYGYMPLHPLLLAILFRGAGLGLFQARFEPVVLGLLTLALTYALGRRLFGAAVGVLALIFLLFVRLTGLTPSQVSGILLLDMARIARYDMLVPVFGLASLHVYVGAQDGRAWRYMVAGLLAGLAGLSHLYGVFWLAALGLLALWNRAQWRCLAALAAGFALAWLPYLVYVLHDLPAWRGQMRDYAPRFQLLNPSWYLNNLANEYHRYGPGLGPPGRHYLGRPGFWLTLLALPASLIALMARAAGPGRAGSMDGDVAARTIVTPLLTLPVLFALLIYLKLANYLVTVMPLVAVAVAWGGVSLWRWAGQGGRLLWLRPLLAFLLLAVMVEGSGRMAALNQAGATTTPYQTFITQVRRHMPQEALRILGLHHYWFGLDDFDYRTWAVPLLQADAKYWTPPLTIDQALTNLDPDVVLLDTRLRALLATAPEVASPVYGWLAEEGFALVGVVDDPTYGQMEILGRSEEWIVGSEE
jgi:hypothetical protein